MGPRAARGRGGRRRRQEEGGAPRPPSGRRLGPPREEGIVLRARADRARPGGGCLPAPPVLARGPRRAARPQRAGTVFETAWRIAKPQSVASFSPVTPLVCGFLDVPYGLALLSNRYPLTVDTPPPPAVSVCFEIGRSCPCTYSLIAVGLLAHPPSWFCLPRPGVTGVRRQDGHAGAS